MELVLDANILFAALIKDSTTSTLLFNPNLTLYIPEFIIEEFFKYEQLIDTKMSRSKEEFIGIMHMLQEVITTIPAEDYKDYVKKATEISPDNKDIMYFALALKLRCSVWSNDTRLKEQNKVKIYNTKELLLELKM